MKSLNIQKAEQAEANNQKVVSKLVTFPPPDGGWGWVVVFASFMVQAIADGVAYSFGLFFTQITHLDEIRATKSDASWIGSIMLGVTFGAGLLASAFVNRFGCRAVSIAGSFVAAFGFAISYWAYSVRYLYVSIGIIGGLGFGLIYLPAVVCVSYYFEKKRASATGIAACGSGFGTFTLAPILEFLISWLGWRASFFGVAAILLLCALFAILFRPLRTASVSVPDLATEATNYDVADSTKFKGFYGEFSKIKLKLNSKASNKIPYGDTISVKILSLKFSRMDKILSLESENQAVVRSESEKNSKNHEIVGNNEMAVNGNGRKSNGLKLLDLSLLKNPVFVIFVMSNFLTNIGTNVPYIYYADMARDTLKTKDGDPVLGWLVSSIGIANTLSSLLMGYLSDSKYVNRLYLYSGSLIVCGIATAISAHVESLTYLVICALIFGATDGIYVGLTSVILVDLLGLNQLSNSFGIVLFCQGVGTLIGPPIVGLLFDTYKHYTYGFWFAGISITLSGFILFLICLIQRFSNNRDREQSYQNTASPSTRRTSLF